MLAVIIPDCVTVPPVVTVTLFAPALALRDAIVIPPLPVLERVILPVPVVVTLVPVIAPVPPVTFNCTLPAALMIEPLAPNTIEPAPDAPPPASLAVMVTEPALSVVRT